MTSRAVRIKRLLGAGALTVGITSAVNAQNPVVSVTSTSAAPGGSAMVELQIQVPENNTTGTDPQNIAAVNFTIEIPSEDASLVDGTITGTLDANLTGYTYDDNTLNPGGAIQYRGVVYKSDNGASNIDASSTVSIATVMIPIAASAPNGAQLDLEIKTEFDQDGVTALVGISDSSGVSQVGAQESPGAGVARAIDGVDGQVVINVGGLDHDLSDPTDLAGYTGRQIILPFVDVFPTFTPTQDVPTENDLLVDFNSTQNGIDIVTNVAGNFGIFEITGLDAGAPVSEGNVILDRWSVSSNAANPGDNVAARIRLGVDSVASVSIFQEPNKDGGTQGANVVPENGGGPVTYTSLLYAPPSIDNGNRDQYLSAFDVLSFGLGTNGNILTLSDHQTDIIPAIALNNANVVYTQDFSAGDSDGFTPFEDQGYFADIGNDPGSPINTTLTTADGLNIGLGGPPDSNGFSFAFFEKTIPGWTVTAGKIYELQYTIATGAPTKEQTNISRLRVNIGDGINLGNGLFDYVWTGVHESGGGATDQEDLPTPSGTTFTAYIDVPDSLAGSGVVLSFDGYAVSPNSTGAVILKDITVTEYDRPSYPAF